jgi:16S rRNA processing protein RimM
LNLIKVGKIKDAQGLKGHVFLLIFSKDLSIVEQLEKIYLPQNEISLLLKAAPHSEPSEVSESRKILKQFKQVDGFLEMEVVEAKVHKNGIMCLFKSMFNRTQAEQLIGVEIYVEENLFESEKGQTIFLKEILHFQIQDLEGVSRGEIIGFSSNGPQDLLVIRKDSNAEFMIPFVEDLIEEINFDEKIIMMDFPEGIDEI